MKQTEYIIIGLGIAGIAVSRVLDQLGKDFLVFDSDDISATSVAGGVVNPVVIKRLNPVWRASEFLSEATLFYQNLQAGLSKEFFKANDVLRVFASAEEQNNWVVASDSEKLRELIDPQLLTNSNEAIHAPFGFGRVKGCLQLDTGILIQSYKEYLRRTDRLIMTNFDHQKVAYSRDTITVNGIRTRNLILTQGVGILNDSFGKLDYLIPKKGEYLTFKSEALQQKEILKGTYFVIPKGNNTYQTGATFAHGDISSAVTEKGREQMISALDRMINVPYEITGQTTGIRPTIKDRRPLLGKLDHDKHTYILNGLGSRGLLMAPLLAQWLVDHIEKGAELPEEVDIRRYQS